MSNPVNRLKASQKVKSTRYLYLITHNINNNKKNEHTLHSNSTVDFTLHAFERLKEILEIIDSAQK